MAEAEAKDQVIAYNIQKFGKLMLPVKKRGKERQFNLKKTLITCQD